MVEPNETLRELRKTSKILILANASVIEKELSKIATSDVRKKIWILIDGKRMAKDIANEIGVTQMAVSYFLSAAVAAEPIEYAPREPPRKILDYVPPSWIELVKLPIIEEEKAEREQNKPEQNTLDVSAKEGE